MKTSHILTAGAAIATVMALPNGPIVRRVESIPQGKPDVLPRQGGEGADGIVSLILLIEELVNEKVNAYDDNLDDEMCAIYMSTDDGSHCKVIMACAGDQQAGYHTSHAGIPRIIPGPGDGKGGGWNACYLGGVQYMYHDLLGDFSIEFSKAGGVNGDTEDGLHSPILRVKSIGNWDAIDVEGQMAENKKEGNLCKGYWTGDGRNPGWTCSVPIIGSQYLNISNNPAPTANTYAPGVCGIHFIDYQIPSGDDQYYLAMRIVDNDGVEIAQVGNSHSVGEDRVGVMNGYGLTSPLPWVLVYTRPLGDQNVPHFAYAGDNWDADAAPRCSIGGYDSGARQGDCSFAC